MAMKAAQERRDSVAEQKRLKKEAEHFKKTEKTFQIKILHPGDAVNFPKNGDSCCVNYIGMTDDGTMFDNTYNRGQAIYFILGAGQVIQAWEEVIPMFSRGQKARIVCPPAFAYGERGYPPIVPPNHTCTYELELMSFSSMGNAERLHREKVALLKAENSAKSAR